MLKSIWEDVKKEFNYGNMVTRLVILNVAVFFVINLIWIFLRLSHAWETPPLYTNILRFFMISSDWWHNLTHPWVILTNMFLHEGFWHILWNMLFLYWFGRIVGDFIGNHRILPLYLLGGIAGGLLFFFSANLFQYGGGGTHYALGASGAVMAIVVASGVIAPDYIFRLLFLGDVKLKYIVAVLVFLDLVGVANDINTGGHFAHLGGALFGWFFVFQLRNGVDLSEPVNKVIDGISQFFRNLTEDNPPKRKKPRVVHKASKAAKRASQRRSARGSRKSDSKDVSYQEKLDSILDKIKESGYESLTAEEKEFLFNASKDK